MNWRPARYEDLYAVDLQRRQRDQDGRLEIPDTESVRESLRLHARTALVEDRPVAVVGVDLLWKGVARAWVFLSEESLEHPVALSRGVRGWLEWIIEDLQLRRVQADVEHGHEAARRWLLFLGFSYEGTMRRYGYTGRHHDLYARLR